MANPPHLHFAGTELDDASTADTERLDDAVDTILYDPEVFDDPECIVNNETELFGGYDPEVVPDSDDDTMDTSSSKISLSRVKRFTKCLSADVYKVKSWSHSPCEQVENSNVDYNATDDEHVSDQAADTHGGSGNDISPTITRSDIQPTLIDLQGGNIPVVDGLCLADISSGDVNCVNSKQWSEKNCVDGKGKLCQLKAKNINVVYSRKKIRTPTAMPLDEGAGDVKNLTDDGNEYAGLSYVDSQEPEDMSKALCFVDQYICVNTVPMLSTPVAAVKTKVKSPPALTAKGAQNCLRLSNIKKSEKFFSIFEWDDKLDGEGTKKHPILKKFDQTYVRRSPSVKNSIIEEVSPGSLCKEKSESFKIGKDSTDSDAILATDTAEPGKVLDQQDDEKDTVTIKESLAPVQSEHTFDVGLDTQLAAEAIQALSYAISSDSREVDAYQSPEKVLLKSEGNTEKQNYAGVWSFPRKIRSPRGVPGLQRKGRRYLGQNKVVMHASKQIARRNRGNLAAKVCMDGSRCDDFDMINIKREPKNTNSVKSARKRKINGAAKINVDDHKENVSSLSSIEDTPLRKLKYRKKVRDTHPATANLNSSSLFNINEGLVSGHMCNNITNMKKVLHSGREETSVTDSMLVIANSAVDMFVEKSIDRMENCLDHKGDGVRTCADTLKAQDRSENQLGFTDFKNAICENNSNLVKFRNWCLGDYPRGKRTCRSTLDKFEDHTDLLKPSAEVSMEEHQHFAIRSHLDANGSCSSSTSCSGFKRKQRSTIYVSPQSSSTKLVRFLPSHFVELRKDENNCNVNKERTSLAQLTESNINKQLNKANQIESFSAVDIANCKASGQLNSHGAASPSCLPSTPAINSRKLVDDHREQHEKKRASTTPLTRELVRLGCGESMPEITPKVSRVRKAMADVRVLLSQSLDEGTKKQQKKILTRLRVPMASCPSEATHFVTNKFSRTRNMLEFIAQGKPVVTHLWLESCQQAGSYIDESNYILRDVKKEREYGFRMPISLNRARQHPLLSGYKVLITPNTKPGKEVLSSLVMAVHGEVLNGILDDSLTDKLVVDNFLILSCEEDEADCSPFLQKGIAAYSSELLLNGILIQKLELARHQLFTVHKNRQ